MPTEVRLLGHDEDPSPDASVRPNLRPPMPNKFCTLKASSNDYHGDSCPYSWVLDMGV